MNNITQYGYELKITNEYIMAYPMEHMPVYMPNVFLRNGKISIDFHSDLPEMDMDLFMEFNEYMANVERGCRLIENIKN